MDLALSPSHQSPTDSAEEAKFLFSGIVASFDDFEVKATHLLLKEEQVAKQRDQQRK